MNDLTLAILHVTLIKLLDWKAFVEKWSVATRVKIFSAS